MKLIIADNRMHEKAKQRLSELGHVLWFQTDGITYPAISGHPDIFMAQTEKKLIVAPNTPAAFIEILNGNNIQFEKGTKPVGSNYPETAFFNALIDKQLIIHNLKLTEAAILNNSGDLKQIHVPQGYCRCNCLSLNGEAYICSDKGIYYSLRREGINAFYIRTDTIMLAGFSHGFIGGTAGVTDRTVVFNGSLSQFREGEILRDYVYSSGFQFLELNDGPLTDVGSIIFL